MTFETFLKLVGRKIAAIRKARSLTQRDTAERAGISYRYFQNIESGAANLTLSTLFRLSRFFGVGVADIIDEKAPRESSTPI